MTNGSIKGYALSYGRNLFKMDIALQDILRYYGVEETFGIESFSNFSSHDIIEISSYVDRFANPKEIYWDQYGNRVDDIFVSPALRNMMDKLVEFYGVNRPPIHDGDWISHMAYLYLIGDMGVGCIVTVTMQTGFAIHKYGDEDIKHIASHMFGDEHPVYYGATWFTEVHAGSDLGSIETVAKYRDGHWHLYGTKYFTSNIGFADYALIVARRDDARPGLRGVSLFLMPVKLENGRPNYKLIKLKDKIGTLNVPTGEIELEGSTAIPLGDLDKGYYYALENLMISRLANSIGSVGVARRALLEAYLFGLERKAFTKRLLDHKLFKSDLMMLDSLSVADFVLSMKAAKLWENVQDESPPYSRDYIHTRLYNHVSKAVTAKDAIYITSEAMELFGGRGFLKEYYVERLHREALVSSIWEGTTNIHSLDFIEALFLKKGYETLIPELDSVKEYVSSSGSNKIESLLNEIEYFARSDPDEVEYYAKSLTFKVGRYLSLKEMYSLAKVNDRYNGLAEIYRDVFIENKMFDKKYLSDFDELFTFSII